MSSSSSGADDLFPPPIVARWLRPTSSSAILELPTAPITLATNAKDDVTWQAFTAEESAQCEEAWQNLPEEERKHAEEGYMDSGSVPGSSDYYNDEEEDTVGVSIAKDKLFEVDVRRWSLRPIYWKMNASEIKVMRGTWFYNDHKPVSLDLARSLEEQYHIVKPWLESYQLELTTAFDLGRDAHAKLRLHLDSKRDVIFEDKCHAFIISDTSNSYFPSIRWSVSKSAVASQYPGATPVFRGYDAASEADAKQSRKRSASLPPKKMKKPKHQVDDFGYQSDSVIIDPQEEDENVKREDAMKGKKKASEWQDSLPPVGNEDGDDNVTDLVLIVHGIGQGLATTNEGFNFVYAANLFRQIARHQSLTPAVASIMRDRRVQFLPVQWRTNLNLDADEEKRRERAGLDNNFTLNDITVKNTVPYVRDLMNNVLIDIPYFMSRHKDRMIEAVAKQANRIYRLWCARNPGFEHAGRVHVIAHSLGSALSGHILSNQPTTQPPLSEMDASYIRECKNLFLFNTSLIFMLGSPFPLFVHINRTQVIARKGRERTMHSPPDEAFDREGIFGCLAVDAVYNIFNPSDPVAYLINPTVDARKAKELPPSVIRNVHTPLLSSFSSKMSRLFEGRMSPRSGSPARPKAKSFPSSGGFELGGAAGEVEGTKEERRFLALNPRGTLDYTLPSEGNLSGYLDMIYAHSAYWSDPNLAAFILTEIFARKEDYSRTGLGVEPPTSNHK